MHRRCWSSLLIGRGLRDNSRFWIGDWVFLRLQPCRHNSISLRHNLKLALHYYGSFKVFFKIGTIAYKLDLPIIARIHSVFYVSWLKKKFGQ